MATDDGKANTRKSSLKKVAKRLAANVKKLPAARKSTALSELGDMAQVIRAEIEAQGWSSRALGKEADVPQPTVNRFMSGTHANLRLDVASKLCRVLGLKLTRKS